MAYYADLAEHIKVLEAKGQLVRIKRAINKDTELHPLVRWQFRGLPESQRKAFLFENVTDVAGKCYPGPVLIASHAASREIYATAMGCQPAEIVQKWTEAQLHPVAPEIVSSAPVQEEVHRGDRLLEHGGLGEFPIPISTPGFDNAPYLTAANFISRDPDTGVRNVGNYRAMVKAVDRLGACIEPPQHIRVHWEKCRARGVPLPVAIIIGPPPNVGLAATAKIPYGIDELAVAGGIAGSPVKLVKCLTTDLEVPAFGQICLEGEMPTDALEREAPFGEYTGYLGSEKHNPFMNIKCITHRRVPIYNAFISQFPPSESSKLRQIGSEAVLYKLLKHDCNIPGILSVAIHESSGSAMYIVVQLKKSHPSQAWQALNGAAALDSQIGKYIIAVDEDIDPRDADSVNWALSFRTQPERDSRFVPARIPALDPSATPPSEQDYAYMQSPGTSLLIDATRKWAYPPVSLPRKEFMERARQLWEEEGLPPLAPKVPWHGYSLGYWTRENEEEAELALRGGHLQTGEKLAKQRKNL